MNTPDILLYGGCILYKESDTRYTLNLFSYRNIQFHVDLINPELLFCFPILFLVCNLFGRAVRPLVYFSPHAVDGRAVTGNAFPIRN